MKERERKKGRMRDIEREGEIREIERERGEKDREVKGIDRVKGIQFWVNPTLRIMLSPNYVSGSQADSY